MKCIMFNCMMYIEGLHTHLHEKRALICTECTDLVFSFVYGNVRIKKYHVRILYGIYIETLWPPCKCVQKGCYPGLMCHTCNCEKYGVCVRGRMERIKKRKIS